MIICINSIWINQPAIQGFPPPFRAVSMAAQRLAVDSPDSSRGPWWLVDGMTTHMVGTRKNGWFTRNSLVGFIGHKMVWWRTWFLYGMISVGTPNWLEKPSNMASSIMVPTNNPAVHSHGNHQWLIFGNLYADLWFVTAGGFLLSIHRDGLWCHDECGLSTLNQFPPQKVQASQSESSKQVPFCSSAISKDLGLHKWKHLVKN